MTKFEEIKSAIATLSDEERLRLREWLAEIDAQRFDERIERDAEAGNLDLVIERARKNAEAGRRHKL